MHIIAVLSGKGGVGKTTTSFGLALALQELGIETSILDLDLENPSVAGKDGVTGLTRDDLHYPDELIEPPRWAGIPVMSISLMLPDDLDDTPTMIDEFRKHFLIRQLVREVNWGDSKVLIVDMPPGTGEEVRGLLEIEPSAAVVVTSPQRMSESAVRKALRMAQEYRIPLLGLIENNAYGTSGEAGERLSKAYNIPLLAKVPRSEEIWTAMESQVPFNHQAFLPVAESVKAAFFTQSAPLMPTNEAENELLAEAEEWVAGERVEPQAPAAAPPVTSGVFVGSPEDVNPEVEQTGEQPSEPAAEPPGEEPEAILQANGFQDLSDEAWSALCTTLPDAFQKDRPGMNGILWVYDKSVNRWADMPSEYGSHQTARTRVSRLRREKRWQPFVTTAKQFGYMELMDDYTDDSNQHAEVLRDGDSPGEPARVGAESEGDTGGSD